MMGLRYTDFIAPVVKAMQEQQQILYKQQSEIEELKAKNNLMNDEIVELRKHIEGIKKNH